mgnify:CR=1 FL=1
MLDWRPAGDKHDAFRIDQLQSQQHAISGAEHDLLPLAEPGVQCSEDHVNGGGYVQGTEDQKISGKVNG